MPLFNRRYRIAVCAWDACVIGPAAIFLSLDAGHICTSRDLIWIDPLAVCGFFVVGAVAFLCRRLGKIGSAIAGLFCGLVPSILILAWVFIARPGFEASAAGAGVAYMLAIPSAVGGALAGVICSRRRKASADS